MWSELYCRPRGPGRQVRCSFRLPSHPRTSRLQSLQTTPQWCGPCRLSDHIGEPALPAAVASRPWGPSRPSRGHIWPFFEHSFIAWMLNYCVKLILLYYYYSCYVFYYIVWLSLAIFGNIVNKEEICLLTAFAINWMPWYFFPMLPWHYSWFLHVVDIFHWYFVRFRITMYYLLGLPENAFFYFVVFHFILLSLNLGFIFVIFMYLAFNFIKHRGDKRALEWMNLAIWRENLPWLILKRTCSRNKFTLSVFKTSKCFV